MAKKEKISRESGEEKTKAPTHKRKKDGKKKQISKKNIKERLAKLRDDAVKSIEEAPKKQKQREEKKEQKKEQKRTQRKQKTSRDTAKNRVADVPVIAKNPNAKVRIIPLGGLHEIGKNITAIECDDDIIIIDCGFGFPDEDMLGVDLVIPDFTYLRDNASRVRAIILTHGHEDHIGGIPYLLREVNVPVYGTLLTLGIIKNKLREHKLKFETTLKEVSAGETVKIGSNFAVEFIHVNHSIADACALCIDTPAGKIFHTGDFKLDLTPVDGEVMNITRLGELGKEGIELLMCESTNAERPGYTPSEKKVGKSLEYIFATHEDKRIVIATFSSNVHRVQQVIDTSARHGRRVAITGRSMLNVIGAATEFGYMDIPEGVLVDISEIKRFRPEELTIITTGSQGEPMSALYRMAFSDHREVTLGYNDVVILSSSPIPGNEKLISRIINELIKNGVKVLNDALVSVHVSGHACQEEIKLVTALLKPKYYMPVHGEYRHLDANRQLALEMGIAERDIFISEIGKVLELSNGSARYVGSVPAGKTLVSGNGVGEIGNIVLRDRRHLSQDGLIVVVAGVDLHGRLLVSGPDIVSRGFVYVRESDELMDELKELASETIANYLFNSKMVDRVALKTKIKDDVSKYLYSKTKRRPMVLPVILNV